MKKTLTWSDCTEADLLVHLKKAMEDSLFGGDLTQPVFFLEGEMGAGKSTFVRTFLSLICPDQISHGSPTFPIVQEYRVSKSKETPAFPLYHIDLYRLKTEAELYEAGIDALLDTLPSLMFIEWASLFPDYFQYWLHPTPAQRRTIRRKIIQIKIEPASSLDPEKRNYTISLD